MQTPAGLKDAIDGINSPIKWSGSIRTIGKDLTARSKNTPGIVIFH
jgi:hypothetical protein